VNNNAGIAGVSYASTNIIPVQVLQTDGTGYDSDVIAGVLWAADNGADVILMGFSSPDYSAALASAIAYAIGKGVVLVAATGNDGSTAPSYHGHGECNRCRSNGRK
jgi:subtilisin family serine protease